jgi:hypothetical protein
MRNAWVSGFSSHQCGQCTMLTEPVVSRHIACMHAYCSTYRMVGQLQATDDRHSRDESKSTAGWEDVVVAGRDVAVGLTDTKVVSVSTL